MKINLILLLSSCRAANGDVFGQKDTKGEWITCDDKEPDCSVPDKIGLPGFACVERQVLKIVNPRDPDYTNDFSADSDLLPPNKVTRCVTDDLKPYWLGLDGKKNLYNGVTASYTFIKIPPPPPPKKDMAMALSVSSFLLLLGQIYYL